MNPSSVFLRNGKEVRCHNTETQHRSLNAELKSQNAMWLHGAELQQRLGSVSRRFVVDGGISVKVEDLEGDVLNGVCR